jgi:DNA-binding response OmpR family regulator
MSGKRVAILVSGDSPSEFENLMTHLQVEGFKVIAVQNRESIVTMTRSMSPDLILLDLTPCFDICRTLKRNFIT